MTGDMELAEENSIVSVKERALKLNKIQSESELQKQISPPRKKTVGYFWLLSKDSIYTTASVAYVWQAAGQ